jgi:hypothetical protein
MRDRGQGWPLGSGRRRLVTEEPAAGTPPPRGAGSAHPGWVSAVRNVTIPSGSGLVPGKLTAREASFPGGRRTVQEANAGVPKGSGKPGQDGRALRGQPRITGRIRASCPA